MPGKPSKAGVPASFPVWRLNCEMNCRRSRAFLSGISSRCWRFIASTPIRRQLCNSLLHNWPDGHFRHRRRRKRRYPQKCNSLLHFCPNSLLWLIPWGHHLLLLARLKELPARIWYMHQTLANGWSRNILVQMIESGAHRRQGNALSNFDRLLPPPQSDLVQQALKDPYIFDFLTLEEPFHERELETSLLRHLERFLLELGQGFAFVGRQVRVTVGGDDFSIDLLFYHLRLRSFVVIDLKQGAFKPEFAGKMNFYLNAKSTRGRPGKKSP